MDSKCPNCGVGHRPDDVFCENCGFDFLTETAPEAEVAPTMRPPEGDPPAAGKPASGDPPQQTIATDHVEVALDRDFFAMVAGSGLDFPEPTPPPATVPLDADEISIGRESHSRGIHPDIDLSLLGEDPGVSHEHAVLRRTADGWTLTDIGSTNGTYLTREGSAIAADEPQPLADGGEFFLGAWTRIVLRLTPEQSAGPNSNPEGTSPSP